MIRIGRKVIIAGVSVLVLALAGCAGGSASSSSGSTSNLVTHDSPHYQADVTACGDNPANGDWSTVQPQLGDATPKLAELVTTWYQDYSTQMTAQVTGDTADEQKFKTAALVDAVTVSAWCQQNLAGWKS